MGIDRINLEITANKDDALTSFEEAIALARKCIESGMSITIIERFPDVYYVTENNFKSDATREKYFK